MMALGFSASWWHGTAKFRVLSGTGVFERIVHGTKGQGVTPFMVEVAPEEYERLRNVHDFSDVEKVSLDRPKQRREVLPLSRRLLQLLASSSQYLQDRMVEPFLHDSWIRG